MIVYLFQDTHMISTHQLEKKKKIFKASRELCDLGLRCLNHQPILGAMYLSDGLPLDSISASRRNVEVVLNFQEAGDLVGTSFRVFSEFDDAGIAHCHERMENRRNEALQTSVFRGDKLMQVELMPGGSAGKGENGVTNRPSFFNNLRMAAARGSRVGTSIIAMFIVIMSNVPSWFPSWCPNCQSLRLRDENVW